MGSCLLVDNYGRNLPLLTRPIFNLLGSVVRVWADLAILLRIVIPIVGAAR